MLRRAMLLNSRRWATTFSKGNAKALAPKVREFVEKGAKLCQPANIYVCDGSDAENTQLSNELIKEGIYKKLPKYDNCYISRSDPADVARVESKTFISTKNQRETIPIPKEGVKGQLGFWKSPEEFDKAFQERFPGCMKGRTMYVIPYSMGPVGSPLSKIGIQLTDSAYVVTHMRIMTRMGQHVLDQLATDSFINCLHSIGQPLPMAKPAVNNWPCNPSKTIIGHVPETSSIISFGSGYGGNALLGKKCFSLRLGSILARDEGWLAEHMLILGITSPQGVKRYVAAAFPSQCGKTNLAMMEPTLPGWKIECVGDDIAWMRFVDGKLRAINPEAGFFGVSPGTSDESNPVAMRTIFKDTIFTNVAETSDGGVYWEGLEKVTPPDLKITDWLNQPFDRSSGKKAAHPNSRFCTPAANCPIMDPLWEDPRGVPIDAILFGGRRPEGVPLVYEAYDWEHAVFVGGSMRSEATAAAEHAGKSIMHDPFAMRPFFGYNFGDYMKHWLQFGRRSDLQLPKVFHVNWFRKSSKGGFLWPGFGENSRVLEWIFHRCNNEPVAVDTAIGRVPKPGTLNVTGLKEPVDTEELFSIPKEFWHKEVGEIRKYFEEQLNQDCPDEVLGQLKKLEERVGKL